MKKERIFFFEELKIGYDHTLFKNRELFSFFFVVVVEK